jgi:hypothetical protein
MSASTHPVQRTLGIGQLGGMLVLLAVMAAIVAAVAIASLASTKATVTPARAGFPPPAVIDRGSRDDAFVPSTKASDSGLGYWQPDRRGGIEFIPTPTIGAAGGLASPLPHSDGSVDSNAGAGGNGPRLRAQ